MKYTKVFLSQISSVTGLPISQVAEVVERYQSIKNILDCSDSSQEVKKIRSAFQLGVEYSKGEGLESCMFVGESRDAYRAVRKLIPYNSEVENLALVCLNVRGAVTNSHVVGKGSAVEVTIRLGELFRLALLDAAPRIIIAHNHPSGDPSPSETDMELTLTVKNMGKLLGVALEDHLIVGIGDRYYSFADHELL
jgi:DNA repair protein RadC